VSQEPLSFFTLDRGTATTAAALVAPLEGRFRLLASASVPSGIEVEALLEDLAWRVARTDPAVLAHVEHWRDWARLEVRSAPAPRVCLLAAGSGTAEAMTAAFSGAGWRTVLPPQGAGHSLAIGELCLDPSVDAVALGLPAGAEPEERARTLDIWDLLMSVASMRDDLLVIACGPLGDQPAGAAGSRLVLLPAPERRGLLASTPLREAARELAIGHGAAGRRHSDSRRGLRASIHSLAALLDRRVDGVEVGAGAGSRTLAAPGGEVAHVVLEAGALVPASIMDDEATAEGILRWSALPGDPLGLADRLRNLRLDPWRDATGDGARLRLAALRAALVRLDQAWARGASEGAVEPADLIVASGGAFSAVPPPAAALALVDTLRRPGAVALLEDHARVLGPIGMLKDEGDRRRLLADLLDDALLPLGSAILTGEMRGSPRGPGRLIVTSSLGEQEIPLVPGVLRPVDLPPGITARVEIEAREGALMGVRARYLTLEVTGGLAGLLLDTREIPLRLPEGADRRRTTLEAWEGTAWAGAGG
jgi:hypothetical protein